MNIAAATEIIADATRRALEELDEFAEGATLRAAVVLLDVCVPDPDAPDDRAEDYTHTLWKCAPETVSTCWAYGIVATAGHGMMNNGAPAD